MGNRHMFPGGNTSKGFVNYFDGIIPDWGRNKRIYILKGGPGVGKNTFMKLLGERAQEKGYELEYFHCASDNESLDAVRIPEMGVTMLDGTSPHIVDPAAPGAVDQIWNLGVFLDEDRLAERKQEIIADNEENSFCYGRTFAYLAAAGELAQNSKKIFCSALHYDRLQKLVRDLFEKGPQGKINRRMRFRKVFGAAYTPSGLIDYGNLLMTQDKVLYLKGAAEVASEYIKLAMQYAQDRGYAGEVFYSPLLPDSPIHFNILDLNVSITSGTGEKQDCEEVDLTGCVEEQVLKKYKETLYFQEKEIQVLTEAAIASLKESKGIHDRLEEIYKECMDFEGVTQYSENQIKKIF